MQSADWYLVPNRNSLSVKIHRSLTVGEGALDTLVLESDEESERLLTFTRDDDGCLKITFIAEGWRLEIEGPAESRETEAGVLCPPGCVIELPHNEVYISHQLLKGSVEHRFVLRPAKPLEPPQLNVTVVVPAADRKPSRKAGRKTTGEEAPQEAGDWQEELGSVQEEITLTLPEDFPMLTEKFEPAPSDLQSPRPRYPERGRNGRRKTGYSWLVLVAATGLLLAYLVAGHRLLDAGDRQTMPAAAQQTPIQTPIQRSTTVAVPNPYRENSRENSTEPSPELQAGLARVERLLDLGFVVWPEENAVSVLEELSLTYPHSEPLTALLDRAAHMQLVAAETARADGNPESATRLLREIQRFHPSYDNPRLQALVEKIATDPRPAGS